MGIKFQHGFWRETLKIFTTIHSHVSLNNGDMFWKMCTWLISSLWKLQNAWTDEYGHNITRHRNLWDHHSMCLRPVFERNISMHTVIYSVCVSKMVRRLKNKNKAYQGWWDEVVGEGACHQFPLPWCKKMTSKWICAHWYNWPFTHARTQQLRK